MRYPKGFMKTFNYNTIPIRARVIDAKQNVKTKRTFEDAYAGVVADNERCMDANCFLRHAKDGTFPHPVLAVWVTKSNVFILINASAARKDRPASYVVVRYRHYEWPLIKKFDEMKKLSKSERAEKMRKLGAEKEITLHAHGPTRRLGADSVRERPRAKKWTGKPTGRVYAPRGLGARFLSLRQYEENAAMGNGAAAA